MNTSSTTGSWRCDLEERDCLQKGGFGCSGAFGGREEDVIIRLCNRNSINSVTLFDSVMVEVSEG